MPKNIIIQEGGNSTSLNNVKKIETNVQGGGTCLWVPEDEVQLGTKTITKNGSYSASKSGFYGFEKVIVNVPGGDSNKTGSGKLADEDGNEAKDQDGNSIDPAPSGGTGSSVVGKDDDGNDYQVNVDGNGNLKKVKLPTEIRVTRNPDKMTYEEGSTFNPSGIIVHGYYGDGGDYGTILNSELTFEPMTVGQGEGGEDYTDGNGLNAVKVTYIDRGLTNPTNPQATERFYVADKILGERNGTPATIGAISNSEGNSAVLYVTRYNNDIYVCRISGNLNGLNLFIEDSTHATGYKFVGGTNSKSSLGVFTHTVWEEYLTNVPVSTVNPTNADPSTLVRTTETIKVYWNRPADNKRLETSIQVQVTDSTSSGNNSGGDSGGGGSHGF